MHAPCTKHSHALVPSVRPSVPCPPARPPAKSGRYFVGLSLLEAESLRAAMHMDTANPCAWTPAGGGGGGGGGGGMGLAPTCVFALRALHSSG